MDQKDKHIILLDEQQTPAEGDRKIVVSGNVQPPEPASLKTDAVNSEEEARHFSDGDQPSVNNRVLKNKAGLSIGMGAALGAALGSALDNLGIGIAIGIVMAVSPHFLIGNNRK